MPETIEDPVFPPLTREQIEASIRANEPELSDAEVERAVEEVLEADRGRVGAERDVR